MGKVKQLAADVREYNKLHLKFFPNGEKFVLQTYDPDWGRFNVLCIKLTGYHQMISKLN